MKKKYSYATAVAGYEATRTERYEFEAEWKLISDFLLPGRGVYQLYSKPRKRKLTSPRVINTTGEDSLYVLTSGMHGGLTSPSRPWFDQEWSSSEVREIDELKAWLQKCTKILHTSLHASNFYSIINSFYIEYAGFGTASMYVGEDTDDVSVPFRFELLTVGEYSMAMGANGKIATYYRTIFMTPRQVAERFPDTASAEIKTKVSENKPEVDTSYITVLECVYKEPYQDKDYTRVYYEISNNVRSSNDKLEREPLEMSGYYEFPYPTARWNTIGSDVYGVGPGSRALPDIKRLQEMEKVLLMAAHKGVDPPLNIPSGMKGNINALPGGRNYAKRPDQVITPLYQGGIDYGGLNEVIERVEQRIQRNFFNDIFLTASRDPNASPLRTGQVQAQEQEKMLRLGPVIERLQSEFLSDVIERCFNICQRKGMFPPLPPEYEELVEDGYNINLVSPLATAQRRVALQGVNSFMGFIAQGAQFKPDIVDNLDMDEGARDMADISGVRIGIVRTQEQVDKIRSVRAQEQQAQQQKEEGMAAAQVGSSISAEQATTNKTMAEAGVAQLESQAIAQNLEMI